MTYSAEEIGKTIRKERKKRGWTQTDLGDKIGISSKQVSSYEKGTPIPPTEMLFKLCKAFDCELGYLLGEPSYTSGTSIDTQIENTLFLNKESINSIRKITGVNDKYADFKKIELTESRKILNSILSSKSFALLISTTLELCKYTNRQKMKYKKTVDKYGQEIWDKALEYYDPSTLYFNDESAEHLPRIYYDALNDIIRIQEESQKGPYVEKVFKYEIRESLEDLFREIIDLYLPKI